MTPSVILRALARPLEVVLLVYAGVLLVVGHDGPGGGFVGGLTAASAFVLEGVAFGFDDARRRFRIQPRTLLALGLLVMLASGLPGLLGGGAFLAPAWAGKAQSLPFSLGTPVLFDAGVFLAVLGVTLTFAFVLEES